MQDIDVHSLVSFSLPMINCRVWTWPKPLLPTWLNISLGSCIGPCPNAKYMSFCKEVRCPCSESFPRMNWAHQWTSPLGCCWFQHGHILHPSIPTIKDQVVRSSPWSPPACCCAWSPSATSSETAIYDHWHWAWEPGLVPSRIALESRSVCPLLGPSSTGPSSPWLEFGDRFKHRTQLKKTKGVSGCEWARQLLSARTDDEFITIINQYWDWNHMCCQKNRILILPALESYNISNPEIILLHTRNHKPLQPQTSTNIE